LKAENQAAKRARTYRTGLNFGTIRQRLWSKFLPLPRARPSALLRITKQHRNFRIGPLRCATRTASLRVGTPATIRRQSAKARREGEARRIAANIAKLPELLTNRQEV